MKELNLFLIVISFFLFRPFSGLAATKTIILGSSKIIVPHGADVGTQVDRVIRDIALKESLLDKRVDPNRIPNSKEQLVPYMEGYLSGLLMDYASVRIEGLGPCEARKIKGGTFADDGTGNFRFLIDQSKVDYATAQSVSADKLILPDTHGFSMIAGSAIRKLRSGSALHTAIACMDLPAKAQAALFLANNGINCYGPCDRFGSDLIGYREKYPNAATIIGTAPIKPLPNGTAMIGGQEVAIDTSEPIVVQNTSDLTYPNQYNETPYRYFTALDRKYSLHLKIVSVQANPGEAGNIVVKAETIGAKVIGVRVWNELDAKAVSEWLQKDSRNRAILFHSAIYVSGYGLFAKFPKQTSFGDLNPIIH